MRVLSNVEFEKLVAEQAPRLRVLARQRCEANPSGFISVDDLGIYTKAFEFSGDGQAAKWLKNLIVLAKNGKLARIRKGTTTWEDHVEQVTALHAAKEVKFNIGQHVYVEDEGRYGSVVDYIPDSKEYLVVLDPFQVKQYKKKDLEKVAKIIKTARRTKKQVIAQRGTAGGIEEFERILEAAIFVGGEGTVDLGSEDPVHAAIVFNVQGYGPHQAAIYVDQNRYHASGDSCLQEAYDILQTWEMDYHKDDNYLKELQDEWGDQWMEILTETFDGRTFEMSAEEFARVFEVHKDRFAKTDISIYAKEESDDAVAHHEERDQASGYTDLTQSIERDKNQKL